MEADISIWQKPGHFYFALTSRVRRAGSGSLPDLSSESGCRSHRAWLVWNLLTNARIFGAFVPFKVRILPNADMENE